jgi:acyl-CoA reductase-like NAD-dependent aldehyde dehydrogenase
MEKTVSGIVRAGFSNAGRSCGGQRVLFVHTAVYEQFLKQLSSATKNLRLGDSRTEPASKTTAWIMTSGLCSTSNRNGRSPNRSPPV